MATRPARNAQRMVTVGRTRAVSKRAALAKPRAVSKRAAAGKQPASRGGPGKPAAKKRPAMPPWSKAPEALVQRFRALLQELPQAEPRQMFGYPCAFLHGNMFMGLYREDLVLRLPEEQRARLLATREAGPFEPMPGRPMREYLALASSLVEDTPRLLPWVRAACAYADTLPPKVKGGKPRRPARNPA
ncbi:MAG TPA: TfoX/Sxy family protein [bacterium]|nr:TfoX/Sxy family protein [bacterium]